MTNEDRESKVQYLARRVANGGEQAGSSRTWKGQPPWWYSPYPKVQGIAGLGMALTAGYSWRRARRP